MCAFVHLRIHSQYSILDSPISLPELVAQAQRESMRVLALTDHGNLHGAVEFYKGCLEANIKPLIGCELSCAPRDRREKSRVSGMKVAYSHPLLAIDSVGYRNLCHLSSLGYLEGFYYVPRVDFDLLRRHSEGLICLAGAMGSRLAHEILEGNADTVRSHLQWLLETYPERLYLDLQRHTMQPEHVREEFYKEPWLLQAHQEFIAKQATLNERLVALGREHRIPLVATNDVHYLAREDWHAHEILLNIQSGEATEIWEKDRHGNPKYRIPNPKRQTYPSHAYHFRTAAEMESLFADLPEALENTCKIAERCRVEIDCKTKHYPVYVPPHLKGSQPPPDVRVKAVEEFLWKLCEEGVQRRYTPDRLQKISEIYPGKDPLQVVRDRLAYEMSVIVPKGMSDYVLIVWDFIHWAKQQGIPMGPGRGSGVGSIVLYLIGVTDIEPLRFHLFFERFINPERISYPDIDVDICMDRRGEVIEYTLHKYGKECVAQIITFGTMKAKMALKDVGRVLSVPLAKVNEIAKLVPEDLNITLDRALEQENDLQKLYETDPEVTRLFDLARVVEGSIRNTGIHAAGLIICGQPLMEFIPICHAKDSEMPVTQYSMKPVESVGMLKIDFLGLTTLTAIQTCVRSIEERFGILLDWVNLPLDNAATFALLREGKTMGIFQLESGGIQDLAKQLELDRFEEIIAVEALYRPGPMDMIPSFIDRKHGREPIEYDHPWLEEILAETYGIMVYQEQVMQIASRLANFSLGEGDVLRRAMGKKDLDQMAKQREKFRQGAVSNGIAEHVATAIFDKMEKFAAYGFNKSHAAAYGYLSYVTAYLKANYPAEWMAALMTCVRDDVSKISKFIRECQSMGIAILPPDVNTATQFFQATPEGIRFAMSGIKGIGEGVVDLIVAERKKGGPFRSFYDFFRRLDVKKVGKKTIEHLVYAGCFDEMGWSKDALVSSIEPMFERVVKEKKEEEMGVLTIFSLLGHDSSEEFSRPPVVEHHTARFELLLKEKTLLGFFLTGHPMEHYRSVCESFGCVPLSQVAHLNDGDLFRAALLVEGVQVRLSAKTQKKFAIVTAGDGMDRYEFPIWSDLYESALALLRENQLVAALMQVDKRGGETKLVCRWLGDLTRLTEDAVRECEAAYEKAKHLGGRAQASRVERKKQETPAETHAPYELTLLLERCSLSVLLKFKESVLRCAGPAPLHLHVQSEEKGRFATLLIETGYDPALKDVLLQEALRLGLIA